MSFGLSYLSNWGVSIMLWHTCGTTMWPCTLSAIIVLFESSSSAFLKNEAQSLFLIPGEFTREDGENGPGDVDSIDMFNSDIFLMLSSYLSRGL